MTIAVFIYLFLYATAILAASANIDRENELKTKAFVLAAINMICLIYVVSK